MELFDLEASLHRRLQALPPAARAELLHVLTLPDFDRVGAIQTYWSNPKTRTFGELLIDCEEDKALRAVLVGMLREATAKQRGAGRAVVVPAVRKCVRTCNTSIEGLRPSPGRA